jgi:ABC-type enterochelin transport system substrate-binding protein
MRSLRSFEVLSSPEWIFFITRQTHIQEKNNSQRYAHQETMRASVNAWRKETTAYQEATEACLESKEPTSVEMKCEAEHEEVHEEETAVEAYGALKERMGTGI